MNEFFVFCVEKELNELMDEFFEEYGRFQEVNEDSEDVSDDVSKGKQTKMTSKSLSGSVRSEPQVTDIKQELAKNRRDVLNPGSTGPQLPYPGHIPPLR